MCYYIECWYIGKSNDSITFTRQQEEMQHAVQNLGKTYTDDQINQLAQRHFESSQVTRHPPFNGAHIVRLLVHHNFFVTLMLGSYAESVLVLPS